MYTPESQWSPGWSQFSAQSDTQVVPCTPVISHDRKLAVQSQTVYPESPRSILHSPRFSLSPALSYTGQSPLRSGTSYSSPWIQATDFSQPASEPDQDTPVQIRRLLSPGSVFSSSGSQEEVGSSTGSPYGSSPFAGSQDDAVTSSGSQYEADSNIISPITATTVPVESLLQGSLPDGLSLHLPEVDSDVNSDTEDEDLFFFPMTVNANPDTSASQVNAPDGSSPDHPRPRRVLIEVDHPLSYGRFRKKT